MAKLVLKNVGLYVALINDGGTDDGKSKVYLYTNAGTGVETEVTDLTDAGIIADVSLEYNADMVETTSMGTGGTHTMIGGLKNWSVQCNAHQDYTATAAGGSDTIDKFLFENVGEPVSFWVVVDAATGTTADVDAGQPCYYGDGVIEAYSPTSGSVGDLNTTSFNIQPYDNGTRTEEGGSTKRRGGLFRTTTGTDVQVP